MTTDKKIEHIFPKSCRICGYQYQIGDNTVIHLIDKHRATADYLVLSYVINNMDAEYIRNYVFNYTDSNINYESN